MPARRALERAEREGATQGEGEAQAERGGDERRHERKQPEPEKAGPCEQQPEPATALKRVQTCTK